MPLPLILGVGAIAAGVTGIGSGIHGAVKMKEANDTMEKAKACHGQAGPAGIGNPSQLSGVLGSV